MKIEITDIIDSNQYIPHNQTSKILLVDSLIEDFAPLFYEDLRKKQKQVLNNLSDIDKLKKVISKQQKQIAIIESKVEMETLKGKIYKLIDHLCSIDVLYGMNKTSVEQILTTMNQSSKVDLEKKHMFLQKIINK
jgi:hypothetical protein